jgi:hypothetical protein
LLKSAHVALSRFLRQSVIRFLRRLDFGCGHVFVSGQLGTIAIRERSIARNLSRVRVFKGAATIFSSNS